VRAAPIVVLASGDGTLAEALIVAAQAGAPYSVAALVTDRSEINVLNRAARLGIKTVVVDFKSFENRADWERELVSVIASFEPWLVVSAGFMKILSPLFLAQFKMINSHPALLPSFPGAHAVPDALAAGVNQSGCTVFLVDEGVDTGPILAQREVPVGAQDDVVTLHERIKVVERTLLPEVVTELALAKLQEERVDDVSEKITIRRALISVYDKSGLEHLVNGLHAAGVEIVSTGSTAARIASFGIPVTPVDQVTGFPECLDGRVKTLHPHIHAGILADQRRPEHRDQLIELGIAPFELVVVNLYPFAATVAGGANFDECVEQIDIGGPSMVRAAAKNHPSIGVVVSPSKYDEIVFAANHGGLTLGQRRNLAAEAFRHTAQYDLAVATWFTEHTDEDDSPLPAWFGAAYARKEILRYGENPHQLGAIYATTTDEPTGVAGAHQLHGKAMSYNNYVDTDAAWRAAWDHQQPCIAIIKHTNPCGIAEGSSVEDAYVKAHACDPVSAFGGIIAANRVFTAKAALACAEVFTEVIIAPDFEDEALEILRAKPSLRILRAPVPAPRHLELRHILGGLLVQQVDDYQAVGDLAENWSLVSGSAASKAVLADLEFAWRCLRAVKSNAIVFASGGATVGIGMGQVNRVDSARLAVARAGTRARGAVAASDAFFPFADGLEILLEGGIKAVVQPGGSVRDNEVIAAAQARDVTMYFTGARHFTH
jgi:phosphoribosylaminoimidazolecarboxamide formyltransferase/IMP cyclohydrolase